MQRGLNEHTTKSSIQLQPSDISTTKPLRKVVRITEKTQQSTINLNNNSRQDNVGQQRYRSRGTSRFRVEQTNQGNYNPEIYGGYENDNKHRKFRPDISVQIADLSSLTAADISLQHNRSNTRRIKPARQRTNTDTLNNKEVESYVKNTNSSILSNQR